MFRVRELLGFRGGNLFACRDPVETPAIFALPARPTEHDVTNTTPSITCTMN